MTENEMKARFYNEKFNYYRAHTSSPDQYIKERSTKLQSEAKERFCQARDREWQQEKMPVRKK